MNNPSNERVAKTVIINAGIIPNNLKKTPAVIIGNITSPPPKIAKLTFTFAFSNCFDKNSSVNGGIYNMKIVAEHDLYNTVERVFKYDYSIPDFKFTAILVRKPSVS